MGESSVEQVELVVRTIAETAVENEKYFGDLDAVVGDGDFGYSMARGFEIVVADWDTFDRTDIGTFLKKIAVVITSRVGGTSGPIWGTAFLRAGVAAAEQDRAHGGRRDRDAPRVDRRHQAARELGSRATRPCWTPSSRRSTNWRSRSAPARRGRLPPKAAVVARERAEATREMLAKRGRASYTGERSIGTLDAGAVAVAVMFERLADVWAADRHTEGDTA